MKQDTRGRVKGLRQENTDCIKHARFKHARFCSAVTPGLIPLTSMGTGLIYSIVNNQNEACGSNPTEQFICSTAGSLGSIRARHAREFARMSRGALREGAAPGCTWLILLSLYPGAQQKYCRMNKVPLFMMWKQLTSTGSKLSPSLVKQI